MSSLPSLFELIIAIILLIGVPLGILALLVLLLRGLTRGAKSSAGKRSRPSDFQHHHDRWFSDIQKNVGHGRADNRCEYTDLRTKERCSQRAMEGDHFYPYAKGGSTTLENFVSACRFHNQRKSGDVWLREKSKIEKRRLDYFPPGVSVTVGDWRSVIRVHFQLAKVPFDVIGSTPEELVMNFKQLMQLEAPRRGLATDAGKLSRVKNPADVVDFIWETKGLFLLAVEGYDPEEQRFFKLAKWG